MSDLSKIKLVKKDEKGCESIYDFVRKFKLQAEFKKEYGVDLEYWENDESDDEAIDTLMSKYLDKPNKRYFYTYIEEGDGWFEIFSINLKEE